MKKTAMLMVVSAVALFLALPAFGADSAAPVTTAANPPAAAAPAKGATPETKAAPAAAAPSAAAAPAQTAKVKIGYLDFNKIGAESLEGKTAMADLKSRSEKLEVKLEARQKQLEKQRAAVEAKMESLTPKERAAKAKEFQKKVDEYQKLVKSSNGEMQVAQEKLTTRLYQLVREASSKYGASNGYDAIISKKDVVYMGDKVEAKDVTEEIIAKLNEMNAHKK
jgi:outer membrane protein